MGKYLWMLAALPFALSSVAAAASDKDAVPVVFGGLQIFPVLDVDETYNSNVFQVDTTDKHTSSLITTISPSIEVGVDSDTTAVSVHYRLDKGSHTGAASIANFTDHTVGLKGEVEFTKRLNVSGSFAYKKAHELRGVSQVAGVQTLLAPDKLTNTDIEGQVSYGIRGRIDLFGGLNKKRYDLLLRGQAADVDTMKGAIALSFPIRSKGRMVLEGRYTDNNFINNLNTLDNSEQAYLIGVDWDNNSKTSGSLRLGYLMSSYDKLSNDSLFSWEVDVNWKPTDASNLNLNTSYKPVGSSAEYGYVVANDNSFSWERDWTESFKHIASIGYALIDYKTANVAGFTAFSHNEKVAKASVLVDYQVRRWLKIGGGYSFSNSSSNQTTALGVNNPTFRQHVFSLNFAGTM